jgi:hypothetical protein
MNSVDLKIRKVSEYRWDMPARQNVTPQTTLGDFNKDGKTDFALSIMDIDGTTNDLRLFLATNTGFVEGNNLIPNPESTYQTSNIMSADLNKDGQTDLVIGRSGGDGDTLANGGIAGASQLIYLSNPNGKYDTIKSSALPYVHNVMIEDFDGDGDIDAFYFATEIGPSLIALNNLDKTNTISFSTDGLPTKTTQVSTSEIWDILEVFPNGAIKKAQGWHNHNSAFNDVDRDGDLDMVIFFAGSSEGKIYLNDSKGYFTASPAKTYDATIPGIPSSGNFLYGILNEDGTWKGLHIVKQGANYYETIQFDVNSDGWKDIVAVATLENHDYVSVGNGQIYQNGTDRFNHGTFYGVLINNGGGLSNETLARISQPEVTTKVNYHYGHFTMLSAVDLNGDGYLDFTSEQNSSLVNGQPNHVGESDTVFMLNDKDGKFSQVSINGLEYGSFDPVPIDGKLGFLALTLPTDHDWRLPNFPPRPWASLEFYVTDTPWTIGDEKNNYLYGTVADDLIDGAGGVDTLYVNGRSNEFEVTFTSQWRVVDLTGLCGVDFLSGVERIRFDNKKLAIDLDGNAGITAKLLGATFGKASIANKDLVGIGLYMLDGGMSYTDLMGAVINAILGSSASNAAAVDLLYTNVVGVAPSANDLAFFTDWLDKGIYTKASFGVLAADTDLNIVNVGLVGLASTGLEYTPYVA